ncbi:MAG: hypothetical protein ABIA76_00345 [Candidatus Diapherotrites archaeon]
MAKGIVSSFQVFQDMCGQDDFFNNNSGRMNALKTYFARGGVVSISKKKNGWPKLIYPSVFKIREKKKEADLLKKNFSEKKSKWEKKLNDAKNYHLTNNVKKLANPLYWKHKVKYHSDADYRADVNTVKLPVHLVSDPKWTPMVKTFLNDIEYRKQLVETVENSVVYKDDKRVGKNADKIQDFRSEVSEKEIFELDKKIIQLNELLNSLDEIEKWAKE